MSLTDLFMLLPYSLHKTEKAPNLLPKMSARGIGLLPGSKIRDSSLRQPGHPELSGPVALRHQIALALPFRSSVVWFV